MRPASRDRLVAVAALLLASAVPAAAHLGSPDVFLEGNAGDYRMLVVVRMPRVIPGVAEIEVRPLSTGVRSVRVTPMRIRGLGSDLQPAADIAQPGSDRPDVYRAQLWLMLRGAWKVRIVADGDRGTGELFVPVGAVSSATLPMRRSLRWVLGALALLLVAGAVAIVGASVREGTSRPGIDPTAESVRRGRWAMAIASALIARGPVTRRILVARGRGRRGRRRLQDAGGHGDADRSAHALVDDSHAGQLIGGADSVRPERISCRITGI